MHFVLRENRWRKRGIAIIPTMLGIGITLPTKNQVCIYIQNFYHFIKYNVFSFEGIWLIYLLINCL